MSTTIAGAIMGLLIGGITGVISNHYKHGFFDWRRWVLLSAVMSVYLAGYIIGRLTGTE